MNSEVNELTARFPDEIRALLAMLRMSNLGGLAIAECDDFNLRAGLIDYFRRHLEADRIYIYNFEVSNKDTNLPRTLSELTAGKRFKNLELTGRYKSIVFFVYGIEKLSPKQRSHFVRLLNSLRDQFNRIVQPIVIWGSAAFVAELSRNAPDFWSWKGHLFHFPSNAPLTLSADDDEHQTVAHPNQSAIHHYLHSITQDPEYVVWKDLYVPLKANRAAETMNPFVPRHTLSHSELRQIAPIFPHVTTVEADQTVMKRGETGSDCYVIIKGAAEVSVPDALGQEVVVTKLGKRDFFGEIGLVKDIPRTATVRATMPSQFIIITPKSLQKIKQRAPNVYDVLTKTADRRLERRLAAPQQFSPLRRFAVEGSSLLKQTPIDVRELITDDHHTVILGEAGGGKTTVLRRMVLAAAEHAQARIEAESLIVLPIFVQLNAFTPDKTIEGLILESFQTYQIPKFHHASDVTDLLQNQQFDGVAIHAITFFMDGLNEMPFHDKTQPELTRFIQRYEHCRIIMTSRAEGYVTLQGFRTAMLQKLGRADIEAFLVNYLEGEQGRKVAGEIYNDPQLADLAQTPLALYMFAQISKRSEDALPRNRGVLFEVFTDNLLERTDGEQWHIFGPSLSKTPLRLRKKALAKLGLAMQQAEIWAFPHARWVAIIADVLRAYLPIAPPDEHPQIKTITVDDVDTEIRHSGLIRYQTNASTIDFAHHTYQEFFAAFALQDSAIELEPYLTSNESRRRWQGTIILLYGIAHHKSDLYSKILGPKDDYARIWLAAQCLANSGEEITAALKQHERFLPLDQYFGLLFSAGLAARLVGRFPDALIYLNAATEKNVASPEVRYEIGSLYRQIGQYERAITHLEEAIRLQPDFVDAYNQLGITYHDQEKYIEALTVFRATTQLEPVNPHHYYNLGTTEKILRNYKNARESFRTALNLKPDYSEAQRQLDILEKALSTGVVRVLENIPILSKLTLEQTVWLANNIRVEDYRPGQIVFHMGDTGDTFYIIEVGQVEVLAPELRSQTGSVIKRLGPGEFFGEIALLRAVPRTATIRATQKTRLLAISRKDFDAVVRRFPSIVHSVTETASTRLLNDRQIGRRVELDRFYDSGYIAELTQQSEVTVLMGDIHGSTKLTNTIGPEMMVTFLDEYLLRMSTIIVQAGGAMDKSLGDSVMGVFGNFPNRHQDQKTTSANSALMAAFKMRQAYLLLREEWKRENPAFAETGMGIGVSTGKITTGTVGAESTMVGPAVNMSSKLSKMAITGRDESEIYIDNRTLNLIGQAYRIEPLDYGYTEKRVGDKIDAYRVT